MQLKHTSRGFELLSLAAYTGEIATLVQAASTVGDYPDAWDRPGSSYLWIGEHHQLDREQVAELAERLVAWALTGSLDIADPATSAEGR